MVIEIFSLIVLLFSMLIHEIAHGSVALSLGDPTAKYEGRLTLNPLKHLDPIGSILLPIFLFLTVGRSFIWLKPVPINPDNFRDQKWGTLKVAMAGPGTNFLIALIFGLSIRFLNPLSSLSLFFSLITIYNFAWGIFNLLPFPPFDGSHIFFTILGERWGNVKIFLNQYSLFILIFILFIGLDWIFRLAALLFTLVSGQRFIY